jgi:hypothetical protein
MTHLLKSGPNPKPNIDWTSTTWYASDKAHGVVAIGLFEEIAGPVAVETRFAKQLDTGSEVTV